MGSGILSAGTPSQSDYGTGLTLNAHVTPWPSARFAPELGLHFTRFPNVREELEGGGLLLIGVTAGLRVRLLRMGSVEPYARVGLGGGRRTHLAARRVAGVESGSTSADVAYVEGGVGVAVRLAEGPFGYVEAASTLGAGLLSNSTHYGLRVGVGYRF